MPFARIDLIQGKAAEYRAAVADIVYRGIVEQIAAAGDCFSARLAGLGSPANTIRS